LRVLTHFLLWGLGLAPAETQTSEAERAALARHAAGRRRLVEIGVWHGVTTRRLRTAMNPDSVLLAVDPYPAGRLGFSMQRIIARREVSGVRRGRVRWERTTGAEAGREYARRGNPPVDFVFIDGEHTYEGLRADWEAWAPLVAGGGVVALHDSRSSRERNIDGAGSARYTREVVERDSRFKVVEAVDTLTVLKRRGATE